MKKRVFLSFLVFSGLVLSGCSIFDIFNKKPDEQEQKEEEKKDDQTPSGDQGDEGQGGEGQGGEGQGGEGQGGGGQTDNFTITLNEHSLTLYEDETFELQATTSEEAEVTWSSSNPSFVSVSDEGLVTALEIGSSTITATANDKFDTCEVEVVARPPVVKHSITTIRSYPLNTMAFDDLAEGQEFEEGETIDIVMSVVPDFETRPAEKYKIYAGNQELETEVVEGEQKIKASYTVGEEDFAIYSYYGDYLPVENGIHVSIENNANEYEFLGFDTTVTWGRVNGFIIIKPNYKITNMQWKYSDAEDWTTASTNTMAATFCGNAAQANPAYAQFYVFRVVKNNAREALEEDIVIKFNIEEIVTKSITYIGGNNPLLDLNNSNLPTSGIVGSKITIDVIPLDGSTKVEVTSDDVTLTTTYNAGQYQFDMPNSDVTITITCTEANIEVLWNRPTGVSSKLVGVDDPASPIFTKVNAGESYYLYASVSIANHYVKSATIGETTYNLVKANDKDENDHDYYKAQITIPNDAEGSITITLVEELQPLTITFEQQVKYGNKMIVQYEGNLQAGTVVTVGSDAEFAKPLAMTVLVNNQPSGIEVTEENEFDDEENKYAYLGSFVMPDSDVKLRFTEVTPDTGELTITISQNAYTNRMQVSYDGTLEEGTLVTVTSVSGATIKNPQKMTVTVVNHPEITVTVNESNEKPDGAQNYSYTGTFIMPAYSVTLTFAAVTQ